jgi:hypothetical protein
MDWKVQADPFHRSTSIVPGYARPCPDWVYPTAVQASAEEHDTPVRYVSAAPVAGVGTTVQR